MIEIVSKDEVVRKIQYGITKKGMGELDQWLLEETIPQPARSEFMLKLMFSSNQPMEHVNHMLVEYQKLYEMKLTRYHAMQEELEAGIEGIAKKRICIYKAILRRGILSSESVIQWCEETREEFQM